MAAPTLAPNGAELSAEDWRRIDASIEQAIGYELTTAAAQDTAGRPLWAEHHRTQATALRELRARLAIRRTR